MIFGQKDLIVIDATGAVPGVPLRRNSPMSDGHRSERLLIESDRNLAQREQCVARIFRRRE
jgi:hypothetical protein